MYHGVSSVNSDLKKVKNNLDDWLSSMGMAQEEEPGS